MAKDRPGPGTPFYLDPPYWGCEDDYGKAMFTRANLARMTDQMAGIKGRFLLSINDVPEIRAPFGPFEIEEVKVSYPFGDKADRAPMRAELLVSSTA